ncbi:PREDICTED: uncharacterized protein LOC108355564, partial [Rhagoletis zephyria]|uniref:uncharacterized protein LOC108355564 n=1 Tax=Rhagoletis zephyria TaxID=28612 RepID=UPI0008119E9D
MADDPLPMPTKVRDILFKYLATPLRNGNTPSEQYLGRQLKTRLDAIKPTKLQKSSTLRSSVRCLSEGDRVQARYYTANKPHWKIGVILKKLGHLHYIVKLDDGFVFKRHIDQLCATDVGSSTLPPGQESHSNQSCREQEIGLQVLDTPIREPRQVKDTPSNDTVTPAMFTKITQEGEPVTGEPQAE